MTAREDQVQSECKSPQHTNEVRSSNIESTYHLKWVQWNSGKVPIVMQRINGPCPLIAIMNVLLFREKVKLPPMLEQITAHQLMTYLGECIMDSLPEDVQNNEDAILNLEQNIHDAMEILPKLQTGLDVNIRFSGIADFEYTPECIIFDLLRIPLFHGWLSDPSMPEVQRVVGNLSYNQLVDSIITGKTSNDPEVVARVLIAEDFLEKTASQLTHYGLGQLKDQIKDNELGILFRNNHFVTLFKRDGNLYQLVTDHGFLTESIIWETLDNIEGDGKFVDCNFETIDVKNREPSSYDKKLQQLENDYLMALSLKDEESAGTTDGSAVRSATDWPVYPSDKKNGIVTFQDQTREWYEEDDFKLAQRLQEEETRMYQDTQQASMQPKPDIVINNHCEDPEYTEENLKNPPPSPEAGPSRAESVINVRADNKITENVDDQLMTFGEFMTCNNNSQSKSIEDPSSCRQDLIKDAVEEQPFNPSCEQSNTTSKLRLSASESQLTGSDYSHIEDKSENQSHLLESFDEDLDVRQRRASHNQSILAGAQVQAAVETRLHHQQNSLPGRPSSSKLPRAPLRSSDNNKSVCKNFSILEN